MPFHFPIVHSPHVFKCYYNRLARGIQRQSGTARNQHRLTLILESAARPEPLLDAQILGSIARTFLLIALTHQKRPS